MADVVLATKENELDVLISNLTDVCNNVTTCLNDMSDKIANSSTFFDGEAYESMKRKFSELEAEFPKVINSLEAHKDDFINLKNNYIEHDKSFKTSEVESLDVVGGEFDGVK